MTVYIHVAQRHYTKRTKDCACQGVTKDDNKAKKIKELQEALRFWNKKLTHARTPAQEDDAADECHRIEKELDYLLGTKDAVTRGGMPIKRDLQREPLKQQLQEKPAPRRANDARPYSQVKAEMAQIEKEMHAKGMTTARLTELRKRYDALEQEAFKAYKFGPGGRLKQQDAFHPQEHGGATERGFIDIPGWGKARVTYRPTAKKGDEYMVAHGRSGYVMFGSTPEEAVKGFSRLTPPPGAIVPNMILVKDKRRSRDNVTTYNRTNRYIVNYNEEPGKGPLKEKRFGNDRAAALAFVAERKRGQPKAYAVAIDTSKGPDGLIKTGDKR